MRRIALLLLAVTCGCAPTMSQDKVDGFIARVYQQAGQTMPYRLFIPPGYKKSNEYPLIVWLHGGGGGGADNLRQIQGDQIPGTRIWTTAANQAEHPAFVVVPQSARGWDSTGLAARGMMQESPTLLTLPLSQVLGILEALQTEFHIDSTRLYVVGQSLGGFGAWNLITKKPGVFAAAIILCGGGNPALAGNATNMPIWSFQGGDDRAPILNAHRDMVAALRKAGGNPRYTEYPGMGHDIWNRVFKEPGLVEWLFAQHK